MIGKISGRIDYKASDHLLVDVRGVGYVVYCNDRVLAALPGPGEAVSLFTDLLVREDLLQLFGFSTLAEKEWHRLLTSVQGIGAKASLAILGALGPEGVARAVALGDWNAIKAAKGVGPKTAQRVVNELKDKAHSVMAMVPVTANSAVVIDSGDVPTAVPPATPSPVASTAAAQSEALSALSNLGYGPGDAAAAVAEAQAQDGMDKTADLIRAALRLLAPKG
ncbi:MAG: Holliday junction branch migration protein RuvA [Pseudoprimorskyibacter sp.]|nr:Holliday junction branch migration protein RuvA [Pseudoprimorskyibacter sp.]